jgi:hypothetical protein
VNKQQAEKLFKEKHGHRLSYLTKTDKRLVWNAFTEYLHDAGDITEKQLYNWDQPKFIKE